MSNLNKFEYSIVHLILIKVLTRSPNFAENVISERSYEMLNIDNKISPLPIALHK